MGMGSVGPHRARRGALAAAALAALALALAAGSASAAHLAGGSEARPLPVEAPPPGAPALAEDSAGAGGSSAADGRDGRLAASARSSPGEGAAADEGPRASVGMGASTLEAESLLLVGLGLLGLAVGGGRPRG